ncbi:MAG: PAS domain S-box protein [Methanomassiliicoccales archaeon]|nr:PAS domain S-box protein [Methanomassiliicoccales archaeon]
MVDDEPALLEVIKDFLEMMGAFDVTMSTCATEALALLRERKFDAVVSDYQMPIMDGLAFLNEVRKDMPNLPFILFTGKGREDVVIEALNKGADFYLQKGGDLHSQFTELIHMVKMAVQSRTAINDLKASEERYHSFVHNMKGIVYRYRIDTGRIDIFDGEVEAYIGYSSQDVIDGKVPWPSIIFPEERIKVLEGHDAMIKGDGGPIQLKYHMRSRDGSVRFVADVGYCIFDGERPVYVMGGIIDITEKEALEQALDESESRWKFALEGAREGVWDWDLPSNIIYYSSRWKSMLGYDDSDIAPAPDEWRNRVYPDDLGHVESTMHKFFDGEVDFYETEHRLLCKDGSYKWILARGMVMTRDDEGKPVRVIGTHTDIDQLKSNEQMLKAQMAEIMTKGMALQDSEETFRSFIDESYDAIVLIDEIGDVIEWNEAQAKITGIERGNAVGKRYYDLIIPLIPPDHRTSDIIDSVRSKIETFLQTGDSEYFDKLYETEIVKEDGGRFVLQQVIFPIRIKNGYRIGLISRDISDIVTINRELQQSHNLFRTVIDSSHDAFFIHDTDGRVIDVNTKLLEMYHITREKALTLTIRDFSDEREFDAQAETRIWDKVMAGQSFIFPWKAKRPTEGTLFDVEVYLTKVVSGDRTLILATTRDVTEQKKAERALKEAEEKYRHLVQNSHDVIYTITPDGMMTYVSPSWTTMLGYDVTEYLGGTFKKVIHKDDLELCDGFLRRTVETGVRQPAIEYRVVHKDGSIRWHRSNLIPSFDENGKLATLFGSAVDITEYKLAMGSLALANRKLNLLSSITRHDILNQIMAVQGNIELAKMRDRNEGATAFLDKIGKSVSAIQRHIEFTRDYEQLGVRELTWLRLRQIVRNVADDHIDIICECDNISIYADPMIETVFQNLMDNTRRHAEGATVVTVRCTRVGNDLKLTWEDDGCGIPKDQKELIFERGYGKNTGLGLFLSREILGITGITIVENGVPGKGARFEMLVPEGCHRTDR